MQTLKSIRKRISSIKGTMKITGAMKLISASKMKRMQKSVSDIQLYSDGLKELMLQVVAKGGEITHPAFVLRHKPKKAIVVVITTDRGLCGGLNDQMAKQIESFLDLMSEKEIETTTWVIGNKGAQYFSKQHVKYKNLEIGIADRPDEEKVRALSRLLLRSYLNGECDQVIVAYNKFSSISSHRVALDLFLPVWVKDDERPQLRDEVDFIYEPEKGAIIEKVLVETLEAELLRTLIEGRASEHAARMVAMDTALRNADEMLETLTRKYNRERQGAITRELLDIIGGAEALRDS